MSKIIVLLPDGTGQQGGVGQETSVWRLCQALVHEERQLCCLRRCSYPSGTRKRPNGDSRRLLQAGRGESRWQRRQRLPLPPKARDLKGIKSPSGYW